MFTRVLVAVLCACFGTVCCAQSDVVLNDRLSQSMQRNYMFTVDNGSTASVLNVDASLTTAFSGGLMFFLYDLDTYAVSTSSGLVFDVGTGTISVTTPARAGVNHFMLSVAAGDGFSPVNYSGTVATDVGTIVLQATEDYEFLNRDPHTLLFDRFLKIDQPVSPDVNTHHHDLDIDAGAAPQTVTLRVNWSGDGMLGLRILDMTDPDSPIELHSYQGPDFTNHWQVVTTGAHTGTVKIRLETTTARENGLNTLLEAVSAAETPIVATTFTGPSRSSEPEDEDFSCAATRTGPGSAALLGFLIAVGLARAICRRRECYPIRYR